MEGCDFTEKEMEIQRLLRQLGMTRTLVGFRYMVYMVERVTEDPEQMKLVTKCLYRETAKTFGTTVPAMEQAVCTLINRCWEKGDHAVLDALAGCRVTERPTTRRFIDILAGRILLNQSARARKKTTVEECVWRAESV